MSTRRFRAVPLTPVHIGTGDGIAPEEYLLINNAMVRFNPSLVLAKMTARERAEYEDMLDKGKLPDALQRMRGKARQCQDAWMYTTAIGAGSSQALSAVLANPERRGEVMPLPRNAETGDVVIPGSAIKGALRTAVLSFLFQGDASGNPRLRADWEARVKTDDGHSLRHLSSELQQSVFGYREREMERDPFRMIRVDDARVPASQVRVDRCEVVQRDGEAAKMFGVQMHFERLLSLADGVSNVGFEVSISVDDQRLKDPRVAELFGRKVGWDLLCASLDGFYRGRFNAELEQFEKLYSPQVFTPAVMGMFGRGCVVRIGRFSHFESLSVDGLRRGENRKTHGPIYGMGASRTVCELAGGRKAPFGWVILEQLS